MNLTIDIGNSQTKILVFQDTFPVYRHACKNLTRQLIERILKKLPVTHIMLSSVVELKKPIIDYLKSLKNFEILSSKSRLPIKNKYRTPDTLGTDRLSSVIAGAFLFPGKNVLVVDLGTCIKYDFINDDGEYLGGSISPGLEMRFKALNYFTGKLPLINETNEVVLTGKTTEQAMKSGVFIGMIEELEGIIKRYIKLHKTLVVIVTGGDAPRFEGELKLSIFAAADLVNIGLNEIIRYNH